MTFKELYDIDGKSSYILFDENYNEINKNRYQDYYDCEVLELNAANSDFIVKIKTDSFVPNYKKAFNLLTKEFRIIPEIYKDFETIDFILTIKPRTDTIKGAFVDSLLYKDDWDCIKNCVEACKNIK